VEQPNTKLKLGRDSKIFDKCYNENIKEGRAYAIKPSIVHINKQLFTQQFLKNRYQRILDE
jgi:hypothetical protein